MFNTAANLRAPEGVIGFPGDMYGRQTTTLRTMDRSVYINFDFDLTNTRSFKSLTDVEFHHGLLRWRTAGEVHVPRKRLPGRLRAPASPAPMSR